LGNATETTLTEDEWKETLKKISSGQEEEASKQTKKDLVSVIRGERTKGKGEEEGKSFHEGGKEP